MLPATKPLCCKALCVQEQQRDASCIQELLLCRLHGGPAKVAKRASHVYASLCITAMISDRVQRTNMICVTVGESAGMM